MRSRNPLPFSELDPKGGVARKTEGFEKKVPRHVSLETSYFAGTARAEAYKLSNAQKKSVNFY
jgi:hypothetical protein